MVDYRGVVVEYPDATASGERYIVELRSADGVEASGRVIVQTARPDPIRYGDLIAFRSRLEPIDALDNAGWREYLARRHIAATTFAGSVRRIASDQGPPPRQALTALRDQLGAAVDRALAAPERDLARGLTLGDQGVFAPALTDALRRSGLSHLVAVSGFNVTIVAGTVWAIAGALWGRRAAYWLGLPVIGAYAVLTGLEPPVVRAAWLAALAGLGWWLGRPVTVTLLLALTAAGLTALDPLVLHDVSFLLSFAATGALVYVLGRPVDEKAYEAGWLFRLARGLGDAVLTSAVASLATLPIALSTFGSVSLVAPISNLLAAPLGVLAAVSTAALALAGWALPWPVATDRLAIPVLGLVRAIVLIAQVTSGLPGSTASLPEWQPAWAWLLYGAFVLIAWSKGLRSVP
ncbi:MAG TPA: ComEC/Rec2 family competence protein [Dehalococcoidia bacterium]|nr:ComEC/Rec2 family competence protein [Dehalococcoidia bacterium]